MYDCRTIFGFSGLEVGRSIKWGEFIYLFEVLAYDERSQYRRAMLGQTWVMPSWAQSLIIAVSGGFGFKKRAVKSLLPRRGELKKAKIVNAAQVDEMVDLLGRYGISESRGNVKAMLK